MKNISGILTFLFLLMVSTSANAAIIRVDNKTPSAGNYTTLQAAHDAAVSGDTIYVYPSVIWYSGITVTKRLRFIGTGFDSPGGQLNTTMTISFIFANGSEGSVLEGFLLNSAVDIDADNIIIKKNRLPKVIVRPNNTGTVIIQNQINRSDIESLIEIYDTNDVLISNNLLNNSYAPYGGSCYYISCVKSSLTVLNNIFYGKIFGNCPLIYVTDHVNYIMANNINIDLACYQGSFYGHNNMSFSSDVPEVDGNIPNVDMNTVFVDHANGDYHLKPGSPASGSGLNGVDMGIYGGGTPFVDGGRPGLPLITDIDSQFVGSQQEGLDVTIKAKSNAE